MFKKITAILTTVFLVLYVALGALLIGSIIPFGGYQVRIVESGSMAPTMPLGSLIVIRPSEGYAVGDVITFRRATNDDVVTHRIVNIEESVDGAMHYETQGDANDVVDRYDVTPAEILGKVRWHMPYLGFIVRFVRTPVGFVLTVGAPVAYIVHEEGRAIWEELQKRKERDVA